MRRSKNKEWKKEADIRNQQISTRSLWVMCCLQIKLWRLHIIEHILDAIDNLENIIE